MTLKDYLYYQDDWCDIYQGDCLEVIPLLNGDLTLITDPPYFNINMAWLSEMNVDHEKHPNKCDDSIERNPAFTDFSFLFKYPRRLIWGFPYIVDPQATGWVVWDKQPKVDWRSILTPVEIASTTLRKGFDLVHCMWGGYMAETKFGDHKDEGEKRYQHPTQKPIKVIKGCIKHFCCGDEIIFDPFLGSGTTCVAAKMLGFRSIGIEIKTEYCDLSVKRVRRVLSKGKNRSILKGKKMPKLGLFNE